MKTRASYRYQVFDNLKAIYVFYFVVLCVDALIFVTAYMSHTQTGNASGQFSGMELSTAIFLFIAGLCSFKEAFGMLIQNGVSRKSIFIGRILTAMTIPLFWLLLISCRASVKA